LSATSSPHVEALSIVFMFVSMLICLCIPLALSIWARRKYRKSFTFLPMLIGALVFLVSQPFTRVPLVNSVLPGFDWYRQLSQNSLLSALFLSFTAGLFEEVARFIALTIMKKHRQFPDGLALE
jgi:uncharacterized membrane protein YhfC